MEETGERPMGRVGGNKKTVERGESEEPVAEVEGTKAALDLVCLAVSSESVLDELS